MRLINLEAAIHNKLFGDAMELTQDHVFDPFCVSGDGLCAWAELQTTS